MAGSKLYKIGTIYTRTAGLMKSGARKWEDRPLWYDIYEAFPPKIEPDFGRPEPEGEIRQIFYPEDTIRAKFYKTFGNVGAINLSETNSKPTISQLFIEEYLKLKENYQDSEDELWSKTLESLENRGIHLGRKPETEKIDDFPAGPKLDLKRLFMEESEKSHNISPSAKVDLTDSEKNS